MQSVVTALNDRVHHALSVVAGPAHAAVNTFQSRWIHAIGSSSYACLCCARKQVSALNANRKVFRALVETTLFHTVTAIHKRLLECGIMEPRHAFLDIRIERKRSAGDHAGRGRVGRGPITALPAAVTSWPAHVTVSRARLTQSHQVPHGGARGGAVPAEIYHRLVQTALNQTRSRLPMGCTWVTARSHGSQGGWC